MERCKNSKLITGVIGFFVYLIIVYGQKIHTNNFNVDHIGNLLTIQSTKDNCICFVNVPDINTYNHVQFSVLLQTVRQHTVHREIFASVLFLTTTTKIKTTGRIISIRK